MPRVDLAKALMREIPGLEGAGGRRFVGPPDPIRAWRRGRPPWQLWRPAGSGGGRVLARGAERVEDPTRTTASRVRELVEEGRLEEARGLLGSVPEDCRDSTLQDWAAVLAPPRHLGRKPRDIQREADYACLESEAQSARHQWVAVSGGEVAVSASTYEELVEGIRQRAATARPLVSFLAEGHGPEDA